MSVRAPKGEGHARLEALADMGISRLATIPVVPPEWDAEEDCEPVLAYVPGRRERRKKRASHSLAPLRKPIPQARPRPIPTAPPSSVCGECGLEQWILSGPRICDDCGSEL